MCLYMPGQKRMLDSLGLELSDGCEPPCKCWEFNPARLQEQPVLSAVEPSTFWHQSAFHCSLAFCYITYYRCHFFSSEVDGIWASVWDYYKQWCDLLFFYFFVCMYMHSYSCHSVHMEFRLQLWGVLLLSCGFHALNSGHLAWQYAPLTRLVSLSQHEYFYNSLCVDNALISCRGYHSTGVWVHAGPWNEYSVTPCELT